MRDFIDRIGSEYAGFHFDVGRAVFAGHPEHCIRILGKRIKKVHFKDYRRNPGGLNSFVNLLSGIVGCRRCARPSPTPATTADRGAR